MTADLERCVSRSTSFCGDCEVQGSYIWTATLLQAVDQLEVFVTSRHAGSSVELLAKGHGGLAVQWASRRALRRGRWR